MKIASFVAALGACALLAGSAEATAGADVIRFLAVKVSEKQPNDKTFIINENDLINGKKVGHDTLTCKIVDQNHANCSIVIVFSAGKLNATFVLPLGASRGKGMITGGAGKYAGAKGTLTWRNLNSEGSRTGVVVTLK